MNCDSLHTRDRKRYRETERDRDRERQKEIEREKPSGKLNKDNLDIFEGIKLQVNLNPSGVIALHCYTLPPPSYLSH